MGALQDIQQDLTAQGVKVYVSGQSSDKVPEGFHSLDPVLSASSDDTIPRSERAGVNLHDPISYIFTSGTTGESTAASWWLLYSTGPASIPETGNNSGFFQRGGAGWRYVSK